MNSIKVYNKYYPIYGYYIFTIFMNSENSETSEHHRLLINPTDKSKLKEK